VRDFLYVSERKVDRMAPTLPRRVAQRLKELRFNAGPVGAGVVLADRRAETAVAAVIEIEKAIYSEFLVRDVNDSDLAAGDWFAGEIADMTYGVPDLKSTPGLKFAPRAAVFIAKLPGSFLLLSGSAQYLLDRSVPRADAGESMSNPQAITSLLLSVRERSQPHHLPDDTDFARTAIYATLNLYQAFTCFGLHPLRFLARTIGVVVSERYPDALILGTPLFVEFGQRD
jgi:hypothetical protein